MSSKKCGSNTELEKPPISAYSVVKDIFFLHKSKTVVEQDSHTVSEPHATEYLLLEKGKDTITLKMSGEYQP